MSVASQIFATQMGLVISSFFLYFSLQIWALAVGKKTEMLATGGGDAVINLWHDSTALDKEEAFRKEVSDYITFSLE